MRLTAIIAERALAIELDAVPANARQIAREALLDVLACGLAGSATPVAVAVRAQIDADGGRELSTLWGSASRSSPAQAALANGTAAHALDFDDICWAMDSHASAVLAPTALAVGEAYGASGAETLAAYITGFEAQSWIGGALGHGHYQRGWHATATLGALGATVTAARLIGLDHQRFCAALGLASSMMAGSRMQFGTDAKPLHAGLAARAGVQAAQLAARDVSARTDPLEAEMGIADLYGGASGSLLSDVTGFALEEPGLELKPYPSCRFTHRIIDAVLELRQRLEPGAVPDTIECSIDPFARSVLIHDRANTGLEAKFCLAYCAAVAWLDGWPGIVSFSDERVNRADVRDLCERIRIIDAAEPADRVTITMGTRKETRSVLHPRGHRSAPMSRQERLRKAHQCAAPIVGAERVADLIAQVESIHEMGAITGLTALLATE